MTELYTLPQSLLAFICSFLTIRDKICSMSLGNHSIHHLLFSSPSYYQGNDLHLTSAVCHAFYNHSSFSHLFSRISGLEAIFDCLFDQQAEPFIHVLSSLSSPSSLSSSTQARTVPSIFSNLITLLLGIKGYDGVHEKLHLLIFIPSSTYIATQSLSACFPYMAI